MATYLVATSCDLQFVCTAMAAQFRRPAMAMMTRMTAGAAGLCAGGAFFLGATPISCAFDKKNATAGFPFGWIARRRIALEAAPVEADEGSG